MPALALSAIGQAASPEQMLECAPECFGTPGDLKRAALAISEPARSGSARGIANVHVVDAVVDVELGHKGQALFVIPGGTPGLEMVRKLDKLGCRAPHTRS